MDDSITVCNSFCAQAEWIFESYIFSQLVFTCSKLTIETIEQGVKYVQS